MSWLNEIRTGVLDVLFPRMDRCVLCGAPEEAGSGMGLCTGCLLIVQRHEAPRCSRCGRQIERPGLCRNCRSFTVHYTKGAVVFHYESGIREAMLRLKFHGDLSLCAFFGEWMVRCLGEQDWPDMDVVVPVPSHVLRRAGRGFNLPGRLAGELSRKKGIPVDRKALRRGTYATMPGHHSGVRHELAKAAFLPGSADAVHGRRVLLVDDITTSGATMNACAKRLIAMGAAEVYALAATGGAQITKNEDCSPDAKISARGAYEKSTRLYRIASRSRTIDSAKSPPVNSPDEPATKISAPAARMARALGRLTLPSTSMSRPGRFRSAISRSRAILSREPGTIFCPAKPGLTVMSSTISTSPIISSSIHNGTAGLMEIPHSAPVSRMTPSVR